MPTKIVGSWSLSIYHLKVFTLMISAKYLPPKWLSYFKNISRSLLFPKKSNDCFVLVRILGILVLLELLFFFILLKNTKYLCKYRFRTSYLRPSSAPSSVLVESFFEKFDFLSGTTRCHLSSNRA